MIIENRFLAVGGLHESLRQRYLIMIVPEHKDDTEKQRELDERLFGIELLMREQLKKSVEASRRNVQIGKIEEKENIIIERLDRIEESHKLIMEKLNDLAEKKP